MVYTILSYGFMNGFMSKQTVKLLVFPTPTKSFVITLGGKLFLYIYIYIYIYSVLGSQKKKQVFSTKSFFLYRFRTHVHRQKFFTFLINYI